MSSQEDSIEQGEVRVDKKVKLPRGESGKKWLQLPMALSASLSSNLP